MRTTLARLLAALAGAGAVLASPAVAAAATGTPAADGCDSRGISLCGATASLGSHALDGIIGNAVSPGPASVSVTHGAGPDGGGPGDSAALEIPGLTASADATGAGLDADLHGSGLDATVHAQADTGQLSDAAKSILDNILAAAQAFLGQQPMPVPMPAPMPVPLPAPVPEPADAG
ncbi:hypothetical protein CU254_00450 [Amycolatopsis sp. AA4]|uniref:hypothetical protein n=1 Tax=Actinomycetes TaxID=1760 RepID=UPI0001B55A1A|nr:MULTISPECIES: hypothetical protein [Actinomycetes]ATY09122.1 hypothetical protein CU254_00450 [Amycolatopsis sp. AA4]EFL04417.1 predicted protein [Streptomyces sp. AA4]